MLNDLIISKVRVKLLQIFFGNPGQIYHVRDLVRQTHEEINAVRRELAHLERIGLLKREPRANRVYYSSRKDYPLYFDLLELVAKTTGLGGNVLKNKVKLGRIKFAMLSGRFARGEPSGQDHVDLLVVGAIVLPELAAIVRETEHKRGAEINYTVMTEEEYVFRKTRRDPFLLSILEGSRIMIIGDEEELVK
jgi:predicted nucleotidyltransferase